MHEVEWLGSQILQARIGQKLIAYGDLCERLISSPRICIANPPLRGCLCLQFRISL